MVVKKKSLPVAGRQCCIVLYITVLATGIMAGVEESDNKPNIIIFLADDMGWGDISSYGHPTQEWGNIDDLTREGMRFTNMYAADSICSPSRASLLTGRLPIRNGVYGDQGRRFAENSTNGLPREEITIAEALKDVGYATGMVGKWHLGVNAFNHTDGSHLPYNHGFEYVGLNLPLSHNVQCDEEQVHFESPIPRFCFLYDNATMIQQPFSHFRLTEDLVDNAKHFMRTAHEQNKSFFFYFSFLQPHVALFNGPGFVGSSVRGRYGDNIREMDWAVGAVLDEIRSLQLYSKTIVLFTSDNGPAIELCDEGGDAGVFKGTKGQFWEGSLRVPGIVRWPGRIRPGSVSNKLVSHLDLFPTIMKLAGGRVPDDRQMDGHDISHILLNWRDEAKPQPVVKQLHMPENKSKQEESRLLVFLCYEYVIAARYGSYKVYFLFLEAFTKEKYCDDNEIFEALDPCSFCEYTPCVTSYDLPLLIYNVDYDPQEAYPIKLLLPEQKVVLEEMMLKLSVFKAGLVVSPSMLVNKSDDVTPCCTPETYPICICNYP